MPELPEVETIRRQLEPLLVDATIADAWTFGTPKFAQALDAAGHGITGVGRRGKYLIIGLEPRDTTSGDRELVIHLGMTGRLAVEPGSARRSHSPMGSPTGQTFRERERPPHRRAEWLLDDGRVIEFTDTRRFGRVAVVPRGDYHSLPTLHGLGPEPFDEEFDPRQLRHAVNTSRQHIKTQLMSQRVVAGLGNIYVDEALWHARVHPLSRRLTNDEASRLVEAIRVVLANGIDNGGTTLRDYRDATGEEGSNQNALRCYGRSGLPCYRCSTTLRRVVVGGRSTVFCPLCQQRRT